VFEQIRIATDTDLDQVTQTLWLAFNEDPLWSWAFPEHSQLGPWWQFLISSALRHESVWVLGEVAAAAVWIPPGQSELSPEEDAQVEGLLGRLVGERASEVMALLTRFDASHPRDEPHYYLSLLGTHPSHRGQGLGMRLLAENLKRIDSRGMAAYLESSNPSNVSRYEDLGFEKIGAFSTPDRAHTVAKMWRAAAVRR
jgi:ribosomal protein S18 acetylase RimI-like enzyme